MLLNTYTTDHQLSVRCNKNDIVSIYTKELALNVYKIKRNGNDACNVKIFTSLIKKI